MTRAVAAPAADPVAAAASTADMRGDWDYSALAASYDARPGYASELLAEVFDAIDFCDEAQALDVGAGTGALTRHLCARGAHVLACEPNRQMRALGAAKPECRGARWLAARGEALPLRAHSVDLIGYGSSFNVLPADAALAEAARVLRPQGHWLALWNHRDLDDPLQQAVEACIRHHLPDYRPGSRREDPRPLLARSALFGPAQAAEQRFEVEIDAQEWMRAWRAHATLRRQAGPRFVDVLAAIQDCLGTTQRLRLPYHTRVYWAQRA